LQSKSRKDLIIIMNVVNKINYIEKIVCFVANFHKTPVYEAIADKLIEEGVNIFWIVPNFIQYKYLRNKYGSNNNLLIDRTLIHKEKSPIADVKINEIIYGDRVWRREKENGIKYLTNIQKPIYDFIYKNKIHVIFGESTWGQELLIQRLCNRCPELECEYFSSMVTRIPNGRFFFFNDEKQTEVFLKSSIMKNKLKRIPISIEKPAYLAMNDKALKRKMSIQGILERIMPFFSNKYVCETDPNLPAKKIIRLGDNVKYAINYYRYFHIKTLGYEDIKNLNYIFYGLHFQPEASIDVCGRYSENQIEIIRNLWRQLPDGWYLVVKEHSNAIGKRGVDFYRKIKKYSNVILIDANVNSALIMKDAKLNCTVTGTIGLESALMGIPAISLAKTCFNCLNYCRYMRWQDFENYNSLKDLISEIRAMPNNIDEYERLVTFYSFESSFFDIQSQPEAINDKKRIKLLAEAVNEVASNCWKKYES